MYLSGGLVIYEPVVQSTIPICWSLPGLRRLCLLRLEPNCFALLPPTYKGLSFLNDSVFQRRTGDIWAGSAKAQFQSVGPCLVFVGYVYFVWYQLLRSPATNCWVRKSACLYNNCQYSGVGSDWGRGDLPNVIFNSLDILHVFVLIFVIRKGPTLFSLLPQSCSSHYPHSEDYRRIAFLLPT